MTYFLISLTNKCNKACPYCVVKLWLNNPEFPDKATSADFIKFLEKEMQFGDVVELTGGEPTLFHDLPNLLGRLKEHGAKIIMRTNGFMLGEWRKDYPNMIVVFSQHDSSEDYVVERKKCLLPHDRFVDKIPENKMQKENHKPIFIPDDDDSLTSHPFSRALFITADGNVRFMPCMGKSMGTIWDFKPESWYCCPECPYMIGAWNLASKISVSHEYTER